MEVDRRTVLAGGAALLATAPTLVRAKPAAGPGWYDRAIIIDALGGTSDPYGPKDWLRWSDRAWAETVGTGVTIVRDTVFPVGNGAAPWGDYQKDVAFRGTLFAANPDPDSSLPFLIRLPLPDGELVLKARDSWPRTAV